MHCSIESQWKTVSDPQANSSVESYCLSLESILIVIGVHLRCHEVAPGRQKLLNPNRES